MEHYFLERFASVGIYAVISFLIYLRLLNTSKVRKTLMGFTVILSVLAYFFIPAETMDLYRLWETADYYNPLGTVGMVQKIFSGWGSPLGLVYVCFISSVNKHLVPAITAFLFYNNIFYIIGDYAKKHQVSRGAVATVVFFFMSRGMYGEVISGIRSMLAFSFCARCIYNETYNNRKIVYNLPIYIFAAFFHNAAMVAVVIRFALLILFATKGLKRISLFMGLSSVVVMFNLLWPSIVNRALTSATSYIETGGYSYLWEFIFNTVYMVLIMLTMKKKVRKTLLANGDIVTIKYGLSFFAICIIFVGVYSIYHRYISFTSMFVLPVMISILSCRNAEGIPIVKKNLFILSFIMMLLSGLKGNLNGIRFFGL